MKLDLGEVITHLGKRIKYEVDEPPIKDLESGLKCVEPVKGEIAFSNTGRHVVLRGSVTTTVELECARCLSVFNVKVAVPIEEEIQIPAHYLEWAEEDEEEELPEEEREPLVEDNILDLTELLRQNIMVAVPVKAVCSEECEGLCSRCGHNLNEGPCECPPEEINPAFQGLADFLKTNGKESEE